MENNHEIVLKEAKEISVSGVLSVQSATPTAIICDTIKSGLRISGKGLHVEKLDLENKLLIATGSVEEIKYVAAKKPLVKRIFK